MRSALFKRFNIVSLADNHTFDCLQSGFHCVRKLLEELGIAFFGAGDHITEAAAPVVLKVNGCRIAFLGSVAEKCGHSCYARSDYGGVAVFDIQRITDQLFKLR
jgi:poly-gamma-glutamate synthesis protein (capsule biosynthesis protein)